MFAYVVYRFGALLARGLSLPIARRFAAAVGRLTCLLQRRNRRHLFRNLEIAFGHEMSPRELKRLRSDIYANFAAFVAEFLWFPKITRENVADLFTEKSLERFEYLRQLAETRGAVVYLTAHLGNWELGAAAASLLGTPLTVLVDAHPSRLVTAFFDQRREQKGLTVVPVTKFQRCFRALRRGDVVAIVGDRPTTGQGIVMPFFGRPTLVPNGHAVLARRLGATIVPGFVLLNGDGKYELHVEEPIEPRRTDDVDADVRDCVARCLRVFERYIRKYRDQWYVFRPVWNIPRRRRRRPRPPRRARRAQ